MLKRKLLVHMLFWAAYLLPDLIALMLHGITGPPEQFIYQTVGILIIAIAVFYLLTEWLLPFCMQLEGWRRIYWLSLPFLWVLSSYLHMQLESAIQQEFLPEQQSSASFADYLSGMFWFMVIASGITLGHLWYENQLKIREIETLRFRSELIYLRYQVKPHFLFNVLNSLYALALDSSPKTPHAILQLAQLMRYTLQDEQHEASLKDEIEYLESYVELERLRLGENAKVSLTIEGDLNGQTIAPLLLLPFVENCFKHGLSDLSQDVYVEIVIKVIHNELYFYAENSKRLIQLNHSAGKYRQGIGLLNVKRRLELVYGPKRYQLEIEDEKDKFCVNLYLQLN